MKVCARCGETKTAAAFKPNRRIRGGLSSWCRDCHREAVRSWRARNRDVENATRRAKYAAEHRTIRPCLECGTLHSRHGTALTCSEACHRKRRYRLSDKEKMREQQRLRDKGRGDSKSLLRRKIITAGDLSRGDIEKLLAARTFCPCCRRRMTAGRGPHQKHLDHIVPIAAGGTHTWGNVRVICASCNLRRPRDGSDIAQETLWARVVA